MNLRHLGKGWAFPVAPGEDRALPMADGVEKVAQSIRIILDTEPGERVMRPDFGCGLRRYLMKPNSPATRSLIRADVELALTTWEPRIRIEAVSVDPGDDPSLVLIHISYLHLRNAQPASFVFPFYLSM